jgi:hypothetical protein
MGEKKSNERNYEFDTVTVALQPGDTIVSTKGFLCKGTLLDTPYIAFRLRYEGDGVMIAAGTKRIELEKVKIKKLKK